MKTTSTAADRAYRCSRRVLPIKVRVRQADGSIAVQIVDASVKARSPRRACKATRNDY